MSTKSMAKGIPTQAPRRTSSAQRMRQESAAADLWRHVNVGRLLDGSVRRFVARVVELMVEAGYRSTRVSHLHLTKSLDRTGTRISTLAQRSSMTKQAMGELIDQCAALGIVERKADPEDGRAKIVSFTALGLEWLQAFQDAIAQAEREMALEIGKTQIEQLRKALIVYGGSFNPLNVVD